jgi:DNA-binding transcriptional regulator YiaG
MISLIDIKTRLGLSYRELANFLNVSESSVVRWEKAGEPLDPVQEKTYFCYLSCIIELRLILMIG